MRTRRRAQPSAQLNHWVHEKPGDVVTRQVEFRPTPALAEDARMRDLYERHARPVYRYLLGLTGGQPQEAEDLLQETLTRAWRNLGTLNPDTSSLRPWLLTVARRLAIDAARAVQARPVANGHVDVAELAAADDPIERMLSTQTVRKILPSLSADHRRIILELYYNGRSAREAAALIGIPEGTVRSRAFYALNALREKLGAIQGGSP